MGYFTRYIWMVLCDLLFLSYKIGCVILDYEEWFEDMTPDDFLLYLLLMRVSTTSKKLIKELYEDALNYIDDINNHEQVDKATDIAIKHFVKRWEKVDYITRRLYYS